MTDLAADNTSPLIGAATAGTETVWACRILPLFFWRLRFLPA